MNENENLIIHEQSEPLTMEPPENPDPVEDLEAKEEIEPAEEVEPQKEVDPVGELRAEVERLRHELEAARTQNEKTVAEVGEFHSLFPECSLSAVPDSVWDQVKSGIPLAASYALYEKKREAAAKRAEAINLQNAQRSAGVAGRDAASEYFSPDEVRAMSPSEVRRNYSKILESMQSWNR